MTADQVNAYFTPVNQALYLFVLIVVMTGYFQWKWTKICRTKVQMLVHKADGHGEYDLAPQEGGSVALTNPTTGSTKLWPLNDLCTVTVPYPGVGLLPAFLQKQIQQVIVSENDWEPLLNRSRYLTNVASPDVQAQLRAWAGATQDAELGSLLAAYADTLLAAPTREMIASPEVLGNVVKVEVAKTLMTTNKGWMDEWKQWLKTVGQIKQSISPNTFLLCMLILAAGVGLLVYGYITGRGQLGEMTNQIAVIQQALGIPPTPPPGG